MTVDELVKLIETMSGQDAYANGDGWAVRCPAHHDEKPSLSIHEGRDGRVLVNCHAGCTFEEIVKALDIQPSDLFRVTAIYSYHALNGDLLYQSRRVSGDGPKGYEVKATHYDENGNLVWNIKGIRRVPYRLPQLVDAVRAGRHVWIPEGEKDVSAFEAIGEVATTNYGGAGHWEPSWAPYFDGAEVIIVADRDAKGQGRAHAADILRSLRPVAKSVQVVEAAKGKDAYDHLITERLGLEDFVPITVDEDEAEIDDDGITLLSDVELRQIRWLWPLRIPFGKLTLIVGDPENAKSTITLDLAARVSRGGPMPDGTMLARPMGVVLLSAEDDPEDTIKPRLLAADADVSKIAVIKLEKDKSGNPIPLSIPEDLNRVRRAMRKVNQNQEGGLLIVDPVAAYLSEKIHSFNDASVRKATTPLAYVAQELEAAVVGVMHLNKDESKSAINRISGSGAFGAAARSVMLAGRHPDDAKVRVLARVKNNLAPIVQSIEYEVEANVHYDCPQVIWGKLVDIDAEQIVKGKDARKEAPQRDMAEEFLRSWLLDGPKLAKEVIEAAKNAGVSESSLHRATKAVGVQKERLLDPAHNNRTMGWRWSLTGNVRAEQATPP